MVTSRALVLAVAVWLAAAPALADSAFPGTARAAALNDEASALYEQGRYRAALEKLEEAVRIDPGAKDLVHNLAVLQEKLAEVEAAAASYRRYLDLETDPKARARVQAVVRRLEGAARERADRAPAASAEPGAPRSLPSAPPDLTPVRPWLIASGSVAAAALVVGSALAVSAAARDPGKGARTGGEVGIDDLVRDARAAHTQAMVADASFLVGAAAAAATVILYLAAPRAARAASARVTVGPGLVGVRF